MAGNPEFFNRKLHSLLGVIPVSVFVTQHLVVNHFATNGAESFNNAANFMANLPFRYGLEIFIIFLPLLYHAVYGLYYAFQAKPNTNRFGYFRNWAFLLQRVTGVFLVVFIAWHIFQTRIQKALGAEVEFNMIADIVANPVMLGFYIAGILAATFHLANGLWAFLVSWGITQSPRS